MISSPTPVGSKAYTLIEVAAVVVLIGLIAGAFAPMLARRSRSAQIEEFKSRLIDFDVRARQLALKGNQVSVRCDPLNGTVRLFEQQDRPEAKRSLVVPEMVELQPIDFDAAVVFDANGCTQGYGYVIQTESAVHRLKFHGISGWYEVTRDDR